jgi:hypothetical protein
VAKRKVVLHWVVGVELPQRGGDLFGRHPGCGASIRQSKIAADSMNVCIDGDEELGGCNRPEAEVDAIRRANHPTRVEEEALACASRTRIADQVAQAATGRLAAKRIGEAGQGFSKVAVACPMEVDECVSEGLVLAK